MKKQVLLFVAVFALLLSSCGTKQEEQGKETVSFYNQETDDQPYWGHKAAVATKYGYYFMINQMVFLYNDKAKKITPLCGRADCRHKGTVDCNAMFDNFVDYFGYYNGCLYMVGLDNDDEFYLFEVTADGSKRTKLCKMGLLDRGNSITLMAAVHRGYFYYSITTLEPVPANRTASAYRISLTDPSHKKEEIYHIEGLGASIYGFWAYGNTVLFHGETLKKSTSSQLDYEESECEYCYYDITQNKVITNVLKDYDENTDTLYVTDNILYFNKENNLYRMALPDGSAKKIDSDIFEGAFTVVSYDFTDLYCLDWGTKNISVYDTENYVKKQEIQTDKNWDILFGDDKYLFAIKDSSYLQVYDKKNKGTWESIDFSMWT